MAVASIITTTMASLLPVSFADIKNNFTEIQKAISLGTNDLTTKTINFSGDFIGTHTTSPNYNFSCSLSTGNIGFQVNNNTPKYGFMAIYGSSATNTNFGVSNAGAFLIGSNSTIGIIFGTLANSSVRIATNSIVRATFEAAGGLSVVGGFGCNGSSAQTAYASGGMPTLTATAFANSPCGFASTTEVNNLKTLVTNMRAALVANGIMS